MVLPDFSVSMLKNHNVTDLEEVDKEVRKEFIKHSKIVNHVYLKRM